MSDIPTLLAREKCRIFQHAGIAPALSFRHAGACGDSNENKTKARDQFSCKTLIRVIQAIRPNRAINTNATAIAYAATPTAVSLFSSILEA